MATAKRVQFCLTDEMEKALQQILIEKTAERARMEAKGDTNDRWYADQCYTTGTDLERKVRENLGAHGRYSGVQIRGLNGTSLMQHCRDHLLQHDDLKSHNFGRGHISGMRFRPHHWPLSSSEKRTIKAKTKEKPIHFFRKDAEYSKWNPLCTANRKRKGYGRNSGRSNTRVTQDTEKVTCPRCLKLMKEQDSVKSTT